MKILSWNIAGAHTFSGSLGDSVSYEKENIIYFTEEIRKINPDIALLQEVHTPIYHKEKKQADMMAKTLHYPNVVNHSYGNSHIKEGQQLSLAILSKYPVESSSFQMLPNPKLSSKRPTGEWVSFDVGFLIATLNVDGQMINVATCHLVPFHYFHKDFRDAEYQYIRDAIIKLLSDLSTKPTIIGGDFNFSNLPQVIPEIFENNAYSSAFNDTETAVGKGQQDYILISKEFNIDTVAVEKTRSDHYKCSVDISMQ